MAEDEWEMIQKIAAPERCRSLVWMMNYDRLLTKFRKSIKGLGYAGCNVCGNFCETTLHASRDCKKNHAHVKEFSAK